MRLFRYRLTLVLMFVCLLTSGLVSAQTPDRTHLAVLTRDAQSSHLDLFAPGAPGGSLVASFDNTPVAAISSDLKWAISWGYDSKAQKDFIRYSPVKGGNPTQVPVEPGFNVLTAGFTPDAHYLWYTLGNGGTQTWVLGLVRLNDGKRVEFAGKIIGQETPDSFVGVASILGLTADGKRLLFVTFIPFSEGGAFTALYAFDMGAFNFDAPARVPLPRFTILLKATPPMANISISPDGTKVAYLFDNPANPPQNYQSNSPFGGFTVNSVGFFDLAANKALFVAQAGPGQAFEKMAWTQDSKNLLITAGTYQNTDYLVTPQVVAIDVGSSSITAGKALTNDPKAMVESMLACSGTLFYKLTYQQADQLVSYLFSAPLGNLEAHSERLNKVTDFRLLGCTPG